MFVSGGTGVLVSGGTGVLVSGGIGVLVSGGIGVSVSVGGIGVSVGLGINVWVEVGTGVRVAVGNSPDDPRVLVGGIRVGVPKWVGVLDGVSVSVTVLVLDGVSVGVGIYCEITSTVKAAIVFMLEIAESTMFLGSRADVLGNFGPAKAAADTIQNRLNPRIPVMRTVKGPVYSLNFTRMPLLVHRS